MLDQSPKSDQTESIMYLISQHSGLPFEYAFFLSTDHSKVYLTLALETLSTNDHLSPAIELTKQTLVMATATRLFETGMIRRSALAADPQISAVEANWIRMEVEEMKGLAKSIKKSEDPAGRTFDFEMTWIVARKATFADGNEPWMRTRHSVPGS